MIVGKALYEKAAPLGAFLAAGTAAAAGRPAADAADGRAAR